MYEYKILMKHGCDNDGWFDFPSTSDPRRVCVHARVARTHEAPPLPWYASI